MAFELRLVTRILLPIYSNNCICRHLTIVLCLSSFESLIFTVPNDLLTQQLEHQVGELNRSVLSLTNEKKSHETIIFQLQQDLKSVQDKKQLAEEERNRAQGDTARLRDQVS